MTQEASIGPSAPLDWAPGTPAGAAPPQHSPEEPALDVVMSGTVFVDLILTGFPHPPAPGTEVFTDGMGTCPGGIANLAVATARLGVRTGLVAAFGQDLYADWLWHTLGCREGIDLHYSRRYPSWHSPVTVALAHDGDRSLVSHAHPAPEGSDTLLAGRTPSAKAAVIDLGDPVGREAAWWRSAAKAGTLVFADAGWDPEERWDTAVLDALDGVYAFTPNHHEAMAYTRTSSPEAALHALGERTPLVVVTRGAHGALALDGATGERVEVEALPVDVVDATGAGDTFAAALVASTLHGWPLEQRVRFAVLCSALAVQQFGGSLAAPGWGDIADWWHALTEAADAGNARSRETRARYAFLANALPPHTRTVRRAEATIARFSDADPDVEPAPPGTV